MLFETPTLHLPRLYRFGGQRLTSIVDTFAHVARLDAGDSSRACPDGRRIALVRGRVERPQSGLNGTQFVVDFPEEPLAASADPENLRQVIANLLDNAVKFAPRGGTVTVEARPQVTRFEVRCSTGDRVRGSREGTNLRKFHRAEGIARERGGTGLGLFIARGSWPRWGRIWVDSAEGRERASPFELPLAVSGP